MLVLILHPPPSSLFPPPGVRLLWFCEKLGDEDKSRYSEEEVVGIIERFIGRHDDEIAELDAGREVPGKGADWRELSCLSLDWAQE